MRCQAHCPVVNQQRAHVLERLLEAAMIEWQADRHSPAKMKQQKNQAAHQSACSRRSELPPSPKTVMQEQAKQNCGKGKRVRYPAAYHVIHCADDSAKKRASCVH